MVLHVLNLFVTWTLNVKCLVQKVSSGLH